MQKLLKRPSEVARLSAFISHIIVSLLEGICIERKDFISLPCLHPELLELAQSLLSAAVKESLNAPSCHLLEFALVAVAMLF